MTSTTTEQIIDETAPCRAASAEEFLTNLSPMNAFWQPDPSVWIFRGHADSSWKLLAAAHRPGAFESFRFPFKKETEPEWDRLGAYENHIIERFLSGLDAAGIPIPIRPPSVRLEAGYGQYGEEPKREAWPLRALAQHHGLPTALLDWTWRSRVAAYFAAAEATEKKWQDGALNVWALRADLFKKHYDTKGADGRLELFSAPAASNPNLRAQAGVFTVLRGANQIQSVDDFLRGLAVPKGMPTPLMRRLSLPRSYAPKLLRLLSYEGVSGVSMFPGHDGVVRSIREQDRWDVPPRPD